MNKLEDLRPNATVKGILQDCLVTVVNAQWYGSTAVELTYKTPDGKVANELLYRHDEPRIEVVERGRPWSFDGEGAKFRLVSEAHRIRLAHLFDPVLAVHTSLVEPLPHQITAVYDSMLPRHDVGLRESEQTQDCRKCDAVPETFLVAITYPRVGIRLSRRNTTCEREKQSRRAVNPNLAAQQSPHEARLLPKKS